MHATLPLLELSDFPAIRRDALQTLQVNLGYLCNQSCVHCHVNAGPTRKEMMDKQTIQQVLAVLVARNIKTLDLTGGAPELNPHFRYLVSEASALGVKVIDRCNLTVLHEKDQEDTAAFLASNKVEIVASLPCYSAKNVNEQRGDQVFEKSIASLQLLNTIDYGKTESGLQLNLVYNPMGAFLPPAQDKLEQDYKKMLDEKFGILFNHLYTITNMPIKRFGSTLISKNQFSDYMRLLKDNFSAANLEQVMCRTLVSVDWQGYLYDCDFNQQLDLPLSLPPALEKYPVNHRIHLRDLLNSSLPNTDLSGNAITTADHCYGCTAGQGSSCGGAL